MGLYDKLKRRKQSGDKLDMKTVSEQVLRELWWTEECTDGMIADLYDVPKKKVTNLRHKWGITPTELIVREFKERFTGTIPPVDEDVSTKRVPPDVALTLRKIRNLNDLELESVRLELARQFPVFADVVHEAAFIAAMERAVRQFT